MDTRPALPPSAVPAGQGWHRVHDVVGPLADADAPLALYAHGVVTDGVVDTSTGRRLGLVVAAGTEADFGAYFAGFPAAQWRAHVGIGAVRLRVRVDAGAVLTLRRSDAAGAPVVVERRLLRADTDEVVEVDLAEEGAAGLLWFAIRAGAEPVRVLDAGWEVDAAPRAGGVVVGGPTVARRDDVVRTLDRVLAAPALMDLVRRIVVVDHADVPIESGLRAALRDDPADRLRVVRQPNLGGAGGYSRVMHEAVAEPDADLVLLLDDDVLVEPAALLRAVEFARRTLASEIVGLQMLDAARPTVLEAGAERIVDRTFWWAPADPALVSLDVADRPVAQLPALHRMAPADFTGWWGAVIPLAVVRAVGYASPIFLKWDDVDFALRARRAGYRTLSLQGAALWHESWRIKDDARTWPAFFHARNRLLVALLHGAPSVRAGVLLSSLAIEIKQLLALQTFAVERRQEGLRAVLAGPGALGGDPADEVRRLLGLAAEAPDQQRLPSGRIDDEVDAAAPRPLAPVAPPRGLALALWAALLLIRHLLAPVGAGTTRLPAGRGTWWVLPSFDDVFTPTADGAAYFHLRRDRRAFRRLLGASLALHVRLWVRWPALRRRYRAAAPELVGPEAWRPHFGAHVPV